MSESVFQHRHRVVYAECTLGNHVYYARYLDMLEEARGELFRRAGCPLQILHESGTIFPVIEVEIAYKGWARYDDLLTIELRVAHLRGARLNFSFRILRADGATVAEGETRHVCAGLDEKPRRIADGLARLLTPYSLSAA